MIGHRKRRPIIAPDLGGGVSPASLFVVLDGDEPVGFVEGPREAAEVAPLRLFDEPEPEPPSRAEREG